VATTAATAALGAYYAPKVDVTTYAFHSRGVTAGSVRCYGTVQAMTALEVMVDEICAPLSLDPIEFRRRNALQASWKTMTGNPYIVSVRTPEILDKLKRHPIWRDRADEKARAPTGVLVGTGIACAAKNYGTGADASLASVAIDPDGRITIHCDSVEIGNGVGTAVAHRVAAYLGGVADEVAVAQVGAFGPLGLVTSGDPYTISQKTQDAEAQNPRWTPAISTASRASDGAHVGTHAAAEAARVIFRFGLWPAALELWGLAPTDFKALEWANAGWKDGYLVMSGLAPLPLSAVAARARHRGGDGARLQSLVMVGGDLQHRRRAMDGRHRRARRAPSAWRIRLSRPQLRQVSADQLQPDRNKLLVGVRHGGSHRDRARDRRVAYRASLQRAGMRPGLGP
jgi:CO/xanthine dehydrogenase Mo-binding subunit